MSDPGKILLIEDDAGIASALQRVLEEEGHATLWENRGDHGIERAKKESFDLILTDLRMPGLDGLEVIQNLHQSKPLTPIILMTAHGTTQTAIEATKFGAYDYLLKPFEMEELLRLVDKALNVRKLMSQPVELGSSAPGRDALVGSGRAMQNLYKEIGRVADKPVTVLLRGESGTGKELVARALYHYSQRQAAPFLAINCAAIPETLLESELFGHERGAFTGAEARKIGRLEQADGGTIFLDEIGDMSGPTQAKLLRVLQDHTIQRLGGKTDIPVNVRVIAATHRNLEEAMRLKQFREDLFYRISVVVIRLPPLRERAEDIPELAAFFLRKYSLDFGFGPQSIAPEAVQFLQGQAWPGNVRELENAVRKMMLYSRGFCIEIEDARAAVSEAGAGKAAPEHSLQRSVADCLLGAQRGEISNAHERIVELAERELLRQAIKMARGNQAQAARWLGLSRLTLREKLNQFGLHPQQQEPPATSDKSAR